MVDLVTISQNTIERLRQAEAQQELATYRTVIMHDFSLDRLVHIDDYDQFDQFARTVLGQKGGLLPRSQQTLQQGGCAANTATTLARLGVPTTFITRIDELGRALLEFYLGRVGVDLSRIKLGGRLALMTALEVGPEKTNIMINDQESFGPFGFDDLDEADLALIETADLVGVFDWCLNPAGTDLAGRLFDHLAGQEPLVYLDTSDPAPRKDEIPELRRRVLTHPALTYLNLNENELKQYADQSDAADSLPKLLSLAQKFQAAIPARLNIHTATFAASLADGQALVPTYRLEPRRTTGAGDSWNGGNILGLLLGLPPAGRLLVANAVAGYYISSTTATRPNLTELIDFMESHESRIRDLVF